MEKKKRKKTTQHKRKKSGSSRTPNVNIKVNTNNVAKKIVIMFMIVALFLTLFMWVRPMNMINHLFQSIFGTAEENVNVDAFDGVNVNANAGLTREQINTEKQQNTCPTHSDMNDNLYLLNYNDFVCFYKVMTDSNGKNYYPNIVFVKTNEGLKYDGALNMEGGVSHSGWWWDTKRDITIRQNMSTIPSYDYSSFKQLVGSGGSTLCLFDSTDITFCVLKGGNPLLTINAVSDFNSIECKKAVLEQAQKYMVSIVNEYFLTFCNKTIEIIQDSDSAYADFNAFYDYIYRTASKQGLSSCVVDVSELACYPIPADKKNLYPKDDSGYYSVYNCNIMLTVYYQRIAQSSIYESNQSVADGLKDDKITEIDTPITPLYANTFNLAPKNANKFATSNSIETLNTVFMEYPIVINIFDANNNLYRQLVFDGDNFNIRNLTATVKSGFTKGVYTYRIVSDAIVFDNYLGAISITGNSNTTIKYDYDDGIVSTSFKIVPASNVDYSEIDFATTPTKIQLTNTDTNNKYTYTFDSADKVNTNITQNIPQGEYSVAIISDVLEFATSSTTIAVDNTHKLFEYQFAVKDSSVVIEKTLKTTFNLDNVKVDSTNKDHYVLSKNSMDALFEYFESDIIHFEIRVREGETVHSNIYGNFLKSSNNAESIDVKTNINVSTVNVQVVLILSTNEKSYQINFTYVAYDGYSSTTNINVVYE